MTRIIDKYFIDDSIEEKMWKDCVFVFDTSALLNFYNFSPKTKEFLFQSVFPKFEGRWWLPNHVEFEYLKNREKTLKNPINEKYGLLQSGEISALKELSKKFTNQLENLKNKTQKQFAHPYLNHAIFKDFEKINNKHIDELDNLIVKIDKEIDIRKNEILSFEQNDEVLKSIEKYFSVGKAFTFDQLMEIAKEGEFRYKHKIPPGYEDTEDKRNKIGLQVFGDLIIWKQLLEYARITTKPLIFITDDVKADWCYIEKKGSETRIVRPKEELIKEISDFAQIDFWMYTLSQFVFNIEKYYGIKPDVEIITELESNAKSAPINYNRFYVSGSDYSYSCLKFFEDGEVISVSLGDNILDPNVQWHVNKWFIKGYNSKGQYSIDENKISFTIKSKEGEVSYEGTIEDKELVLNVHSLINGKKSTKKYNTIEEK